MNKNKLPVFILIIILIAASCMFCQGCITEAQISRFATKYPGAFKFIVMALMSSSAKLSHFDEYIKESWDIVTPERIEDKRREIDDKHNTVLFNAIVEEYDFDSSQTAAVVGAKSDMGPIESTSESNSVTLSATQKGMVTKAPMVQDKKGSITLTGNVDGAGDLKMIIDLDTGNVSGTYYIKDAQDEWPYISAECNGVVSGKMDLETNAIEAILSGSCTWHDGDVTDFSCSITGTLSEDNSTVSGSGIVQDGETFSWGAKS